MKYTLDEFKNVWNGNSANDILNQFYYEHIELQKALERIANLQIDKSQLTNNWNELEEWLKEKVNEDWDFSTGERNACDAYDNVLDRMKEIEEGRSERG